MTQLIQRVTASAFVLGFVAAVLVAAAHPSAMVQGKVTDAALKDRIEHRLQTDPDVRKYDIRVKVDSGDVKLEGTVATADQKAEVETLAKMAGVDDIDNDINVDKDANQVLANRACKGLRRDGEALSDSWITNKVQWFFVGEPSLDGSAIEVKTKDHVVTLDGKVRTDEARARANELAAYPDGVVKVVDKLKVDRD